MALLVEASVALISARGLLATTDFPDYARRQGGFAHPDDGQMALKSQTASPEIVGRIRWAVRCAAERLPIRLVCLPQAMAARAMLKRRGIGSVLHFGTGWSADRPMYAHAWLESAGVEVTGYPLDKDITEVACLI